MKRTIEWLLNSLNPHHVALTRANAYTRFTLLTLARCFLDYADAEFARETEESLPRARALYMTVIDLLGSAALQPEEADLGSFPQNPVPQSLRLRAETNLLKLRTGRNFAGMQRPIELPSRDGASALQAVVTGGVAVPSRRSGLRPTPYYYAVLIERAKQLVAIAQQVEAAYLSALERTDAENYGRLEAGHALDLAWTNVDLQRLREKEAAGGEELANRQRARADAEELGYQSWIAVGRLAAEEALVQNYKDMRKYQNLIAGTDALLTFTQTFAEASSGGFMGTGIGIGTGGAIAVGALAAAKAGLSMALNNQQTHAQINSLRASQELREREWGLRRTLANKDVLIADQQIQIARDHLMVARQEAEIALAQADHARTVADFLANKFTNAELYEWMSGVLGQVYAYFLRQATAVAQLAQIQLAFERQETPPSFIQEDYWQAASSRSNGAVGRRRTGPARSDRVRPSPAGRLPSGPARVRDEQAQAPVDAHDLARPDLPLRVPAAPRDGPAPLRHPDGTVRPGVPWALPAPDPPGAHLGDRPGAAHLWDQGHPFGLRPVAGGDRGRLPDRRGPPRPGAGRLSAPRSAPRASSSSTPNPRCCCPSRAWASIPSGSSRCPGRPTPSTTARSPTCS